MNYDSMAVEYRMNWLKNTPPSQMVSQVLEYSDVQFAVTSGISAVYDLFVFMGDEEKAKLVVLELGGKTEHKALFLESIRQAEHHLLFGETLPFVEARFTSFVEMYTMMPAHATPLNPKPPKRIPQL